MDTLKKTAAGFEGYSSLLDGLSGDDMTLLANIAAFLKKMHDVHGSSWVVVENPTGLNIVMKDRSGAEAAADSATGSKRRSIGFMADSFVSIAPDFDTCLDGLEEYV